MDALPVAQLTTTVLLNLAIAIIVGASLATAWLHGSPSAWAAQRLAALRLAMLAASGAALAAYTALLWLDVASMAEVPLAQAAEALGPALASTHYGFAWTIGISALGAVAIATIVRWRHARSAAALRLAALGVFLYSRSIVSHAGSAGDISWAVAVDWLHFALASTWVGAVLVAGLLVLRRPAGAAADEGRDRAGYIQALSNAATIALAGIVATGLLSAWRGLGSIANLTGNPFATVLLAKIALVAVAALLGGFNRFVAMPRLLQGLRANARPVAPLFTAILQAEALILAAVLAMAAILSSTSPPTAG